MQAEVHLNLSLAVYFGNYKFKHAQNMCGTLASFVLIVSVPRGDQSKSKITFGDSYTMVKNSRA